MASKAQIYEELEKLLEQKLQTKRKLKPDYDKAMQANQSARLSEGQRVQNRLKAIEPYNKVIKDIEEIRAFMTELYGSKEQAAPSPVDAFIEAQKASMPQPSQPPRFMPSSERSRLQQQEDAKAEKLNALSNKVDNLLKSIESITTDSKIRDYTKGVRSAYNRAVDVLKNPKTDNQTKQQTMLKMLKASKDLETVLEGEQNKPSPDSPGHR